MKKEIEPYRDNLVELKWMVSDKVTVDHEITGHVTQILIDFPKVIQYKVEWFNNGQLCSGWFHEGRLT